MRIFALRRYFFASSAHNIFMTKQKVNFASRRKKLHNIWSTRLDEFFNYKKLFFVFPERKKCFLVKAVQIFPDLHPHQKEKKAQWTREGEAKSPAEDIRKRWGVEIKLWRRDEINLRGVYCQQKRDSLREFINFVAISLKIFPSSNL